MTPIRKTEFSRLYFNKRLTAELMRATLKTTLKDLHHINVVDFVSKKTQERIICIDLWVYTD